MDLLQVSLLINKQTGGRKWKGKGEESETSLFPIFFFPPSRSFIIIDQERDLEQVLLCNGTGHFLPRNRPICKAYEAYSIVCRLRNSLFITQGNNSSNQTSKGPSLFHFFIRKSHCHPESFWGTLKLRNT